MSGQTSVRQAVTGWRDAMEQWIERQLGGEATTEDDLAFGFMPEAVLIEEAPVPIGTHITLYVALILLAVAILWSIFGSLDRIVVASGKVATRVPMLVMQPFTTSRLLQVNIRPGDEVKKGQVLATFDPVFAQADVAALGLKADSLAAQTDRLKAQLGGAPFPIQKDDSSARLTQRKIFEQETADYAAEMKQRASRIAGLNALISANQQSLAGIRTQYEMTKRVSAIQRRLRSLQAAAELDVMRAESAEVDMDLKLKNTLGDGSKLVEQRKEALQERNAYVEKWRSDHNQSLVKAEQDMIEARESLKKAQRLKEFASISAPVDGIVLQVAERSTGSVLREGETLLTLVPKSAELYIDASTLSRDISYIKPGDAVRVKLEAYPFQIYGILDGILSVVGPDSLPLKEDDASRQVYRVQVRLTDSAAALAKRSIYIRPGMIANAEIKTGKRSVASYILQPIMKVTDESMREP
jgi:hemolysin D